MMCTQNVKVGHDLDLSSYDKGNANVVTVENAENLIFD